jgi:bifunctional DNA-binding transcriptional regulator/antitoxin component of YhaV-PrlF toxin-antitoxin module
MASSDDTTKRVKPLRSGQITIPVEFRRRLGITDQSVLEMSVEDDELRVRVLEVRRPSADSRWLKDLYEEFAPVRQEAIDRGYTEGEIDDVIDDAIAAVREKRG